MKKHSTKKALIASLLMLCLSFSMLAGTTFAWFTDSVSSNGNVIQTGRLKVGMEYAEGSLDPATATFEDATDGAIFTHANWEPGFAQARHLKVSNLGTLALNYQLRIVADDVITKLADVIDVYCFAEAKDLERLDLDKGNTDVYLGTLTEVLGAKKNLANKAFGSLEVGQSATHTLVLKMQESANDDYQGMDLGSTFSIKLIATQKTSESDSFDNLYDKDALWPLVPPAVVKELADKKITATMGIGGASEPMELDTAFEFAPGSSLADAEKSAYRYWHADFVVKADHNVPANSMALAGYYEEWCRFNNYNWVALASDTAVTAGTEIRLVELLGATVNWEELCNYGDRGDSFKCGAVDLTGENEGTILTVELRLYETEAPSAANGNSHNVETGVYKVIGSFTHTFGGEYITLDDNSVVFYGDDEEVTLYDTSDVETEIYYIPDGVTQLGNYSLSYNDTIETVVLPESVESLGRAFDSNDTIKKVVLNEGLETIESRAFKATTALEEVVIPSTVKTVADDAFQKTGLKTVTIPASVEYVGAQAFGASKIETVIFEGNPTIQNKAFRGCANLRTVIFYGDDVTFENTTGQANCWFCNSESSNPNTSDITFHVANDTVANKVRAAMGLDIEKVEIIVDVEIVNDDASLANAVANATDKTATIVLANGTYSNNLDLTIAALGHAECEDLIFKAAGDDVVFTGTVTIGYRQQNVGAATYDAKITFDGVTFDHAETGKHCLNVQDVESFHMVNCTVIGDGEYGFSTPGSNGTGDAKIENCKFINAGLQISGKFAQTLVIDNCEFEESVINVQGGGPLGPTIQNSKFGITLTAAHSGESFYVIRNSNAGANIKVNNCKIDVDAEEGFVGVAGSKGWGVFVNRIASYNMDVNNVTITMTDAALAQPALKVATCLSTGKINMTDVTVNGIAQ